MSEIMAISLMVFVAFVAALTLCEWACKRWIRTRRQREQAFGDERRDWPHGR
jgi:hypothetical protein